MKIKNSNGRIRKIMRIIETLQKKKTLSTSDFYFIIYLLNELEEELKNYIQPVRL